MASGAMRHSRQMGGTRVQLRDSDEDVMLRPKHSLTRNVIELHSVNPEEGSIKSSSDSFYEKLKRKHNESRETTSREGFIDALVEQEHPRRGMV